MNRLSNLRLQNLRVLITRPKHQAQTLASKISAAGGRPILFPTIKIIDPPDLTELRAIVSRLNEFHAAIFISQNAVLKTLPHWPAHLSPQLNVVAIGAATANCLKQSRIRVDLVPLQANSETLLTLSIFKHIKNKKIIIFAGLGGRTLLQETLTNRGAIVTKAIAYQRVSPFIEWENWLAIWNAKGIDVIVTTSNDCVKNLIEMLGRRNFYWLRKIPLLTGSQRVADFAKTLGFETIFLGDSMSDEDMVRNIHEITLQRY